MKKNFHQKIWTRYKKKFINIKEKIFRWNQKALKLKKNNYKMEIYKKKVSLKKFMIIVKMQMEL